MDQYLNKAGLDALWRKIIAKIADLGFVDEEWERIKNAFENAGYNITKDQIRALQNAVEHKIIAEKGTIDDFNPDSDGDYKQMFKGADYMLISPAPSKNISTDSSVNRSAEEMYDGCTSLVTIPKIEFGNILSTKNMFHNCTSLVDVPEMHLDSVTTTEGMFRSCRSLSDASNITCGETLTNTSGMFKTCDNLLISPTIPFLTVKNSSEMFSDCKKLKTIGNFVFGLCENYEKMFFNCTSLEDDSQSLMSFTTKGNVVKPISVNFSNMFDRCDLIQTPAFLYKALNYYKTSGSINCKGMYARTGINSLINGNFSFNDASVNFSELFANCNSLKTLRGTIDISNLYKIDLSQMFYRCSEMKEIVGSFRIRSKNIICDHMFEGCVNLKSFNGIFDNIGGTVTSAKGMFKYCNNIEDSIIETLSLIPNFMYGLEYADEMFYGCLSITKNPYNTTYNNLITADRMFMGCSNLKEVDMPGTIRLQSAIEMFADSGITEIKNLDLSNVTGSNAEGIFWGCDSLTHINGGLGAIHDVILDFSETNLTDQNDWSDIAYNASNNGTLIISEEIYDVLEQQPYTYDTSKKIIDVFISNDWTIITKYKN